MYAKKTITHSIYNTRTIMNTSSFKAKETTSNRSSIYTRRNERTKKFSQQEFDSPNPTLSSVSYGKQRRHSLPWYTTVHEKITKVCRKVSTAAPKENHHKDECDDEFCTDGRPKKSPVTYFTIKQNCDTDRHDSGHSLESFGLPSLFVENKDAATLLQIQTRFIFTSNVPIELPKHFTEHDYTVLSNTRHRRRQAVWCVVYDGKKPTKI